MSVAAPLVVFLALLVAMVTIAIIAAVAKADSEASKARGIQIRLPDENDAIREALVEIHDLIDSQGARLQDLRDAIDEIEK